MPKITFAVAGSLAGALTGFAHGFAVRTRDSVDIHHGPAGLLTKAIQEGLPVDVFVSASPEGPQALHRSGLFGPHRIIARNRMVLAARPGLDAPAGDALALLADPRWRIGMSTPRADPGGDYAAAFLDRLVATDPGRWRDLRDRCTGLYGAVLPVPDGPPRSPALAALSKGRADMLIVYATTADRIAKALPGTRILPLPLELAPLTEICACVRCGPNAPARRLLDELQGPEVAALLHSHGFLAP
ncbi:substrate-binding domain-containing protein [Paracoccus alkenifer]|uniref:Molybdate transport system substrate-binding protein n=1 Tax=Paracoccus alkenifer TaxID=65735 RepID=A0A1H6MPG4_9RHOB|nr:substrate-binding domain-containing protein [Paracoccus alkenifer]SEI00448.1 molybdate transport system substrate-binding protein [Paracoccus alkenifer]